MHPGITAKRRAEAQERIGVAIEKLVKKFKLNGVDPESLNITGRDSAIVDMLKAEATADLLEKLVEKIAKGTRAEAPAEPTAEKEA